MYTYTVYSIKIHGIPIKAYFLSSRAHLANHDELISKSFQGSQGRAYLFNSVVNIGCGQAEERVLLTGLHAVADIYCDCCKTVLGWKYEQAYESSQKYKEGKFIIELAHMIKENGWENESWKSYTSSSAICYWLQTLLQLLNSIYYISYPSSLKNQSFLLSISFLDIKMPPPKPPTISHSIQKKTKEKM